MVELHVEAINRATASHPARSPSACNLCWGNYDGPHTHDVPLEAVAADRGPGAGRGPSRWPLANPRHQHEYRVLRQRRLPDAMLLLPGVIDTTTNYVEHPEVVADRICAAVEAVGDRNARDRLDRLRLRHLRGLGDGGPRRWCGPSSAPSPRGAAIASRRLWS